MEPEKRSEQPPAPAPAQYQYAPVEQTPFAANGAEALAALASYLLAALYTWSFLHLDLLFVQAHIGSYEQLMLRYRVGQFAFVALYFGGVELLARRLGKRPATGEAIFYGLCALLIGASALAQRQNAVGALGALALHGLAALWPLCRAGALSGGATGPWTVLDGLYSLFGLPFAQFFLRLRTLAFWVRHRRQRASRPARSYKLLPAYLLAVGAALGGLLLAVNLLGAADENFAGLFQAALAWLGDLPALGIGAQRFLWSLVCGVPVGMYLYGLCAGALRREGPPVNAAAGRAALAKGRVYPGRLFAVLAAVFVLLYGLFIAMQAGYLFGALRGHLPAGFTFAEYARRGFFELCAVMALNFGLFACANFFYKEEKRPKELQIVLLLLLVMSLLFAVTALSKLVLYISVYGFTPLRLLSFWGILVLTFGTVASALSLWRPVGAVQKTAWFALAAFTLLCFY